jgi:TPR repeat protein
MTTPKAKLAGLALIAAMCVGFTLGLTAPVWAGLDEGVAAYQRGDYATALREWRSLTKQGNAKAQFNLGIMYSNGQGVPQDYAKALQWFRKAAEQGNAEAQRNLGVMYADGEGVPQDYAKAVKWYRTAAKQGQTGAQFNLGVMYRKGQGVEKDPAEAALWFQRAAEAGLAEAQYTMGRMRHLGVVLLRDERRALAWYHRAAAQGHPKAKDHVKALDAAGVTPLPPEAGAFRIQLGALDSATAAEAEWRRLKRHHRDSLEALRHRVQRADLGAKGVFYRLQAGPLADAGRAKGMCETLARHNVPCLVITP